MKLGSGKVAGEQLGLEVGLQSFINEQPILMPYFHVPPVRGVNTERGERELVKRKYHPVKANPFLVQEPPIPGSRAFFRRSVFCFIVFIYTKSLK